jgi:hypothetical protein
MPAGSTYTPIATTTGDGSSATITFSSIPSTYTDLILVLAGETSTVSDFTYRVNSDSGTNYSRTLMIGTGSSALSSRDSNQAQGYLLYNSPSSGTYNFQYEMQFMNYANTNVNKTILIRSSISNRELYGEVHMWRNSSTAINSIAITRSSSSFATTTVATLYGIAAA